MFSKGDQIPPPDTLFSPRSTIPDSVSVENEGGRGAVIIVCEHASNQIPDRYRALGLSRDQLAGHIAWDPGALAVARRLSERLDAPLVASRVSRLVIDCNRDPALFDSIPQLSEATPIPGNRDLLAEDRAERVRDVYAPFHRTVARLVEAKRRMGPLALLGVHTFTPVYKNIERPWHIGILFDRDERLSGPILERLQAEGGLVIGRNEPYGPKDRVYHTLDRHAQSLGLPSVMFEIRNDLAADAAGEGEWAERLGRIVAEALPSALAEELVQPAR